MNGKNLSSIMQRATHTAFDKAAQISQQGGDKDLLLYNQLNQNDFVELMKKHGEDNVIRYIQAMESKRILGGNNGS